MILVALYGNSTDRVDCTDRPRIGVPDGPWVTMRLTMTPTFLDDADELFRSKAEVSEGGASHRGSNPRGDANF